MTPLPEDPSRLVQLLVDALTSRNWPLAVALAVVLLILLVRKYALPMLAERFPWATAKWVPPVLALLLSAGLTVGAALLAGTPLTLGLVLGSVLMGALSAVGLHSSVKNTAEGISQGKGSIQGSSVVGKPPGEPLR